MTKHGLTVAKLKRFLRAHLQDKSSAELFQELSNVERQEKESQQQTTVCVLVDVSKTMRPWGFPPPFFLLYGQPPFLPVDLLFPPKNEPETSDWQTYEEKWAKRMPFAFEIAQKTVKNLQPKARDIMTEQSGMSRFSQVAEYW